MSEGRGIGGAGRTRSLGRRFGRSNEKRRGPGGPGRPGRSAKICRRDTGRASTWPWVGAVDGLRRGDTASVGRDAELAFTPAGSRGPMDAAVRFGPPRRKGGAERAGQERFEEGKKTRPWDRALRGLDRRAAGTPPASDAEGGFFAHGTWRGRGRGSDDVDPFAAGRRLAQGRQNLSPSWSADQAV